MSSGSITSKANRTAFLAVVLMLTPSAFAVAETGESPQSRNTTISIIIPERVSVREVEQVSLSASGPARGDEGTIDLCVWSQGGAGGYRVTVVSDTGGYTLTNAGATGDVDFTVRWSNQANRTSGTAIPYDTAIPLAPIASTTPACGGPGNANSTIVVDTAEGELSLQEANAAGYDATLIVTIAAAP